MAIYFMRVRSVARAAGTSGSRATSAAAYRAGERIRDARTGRLYDHRRRTDVLHKEIILPVTAAGAGTQARRPGADGAALRIGVEAGADRGVADGMAWALDRATLWNAAERAESRRNSRTAREYILALPHELSPAQRLALSRGFAREIAGRFGNAVDLVIHAPRTDARNFHAHLLTTTRVVTADGLGAKTTFELSDSRRREQGLPEWRLEVQHLRERWADHTNEALRAAGLEVRVSQLRDPDASREGARAWLPRIAWEIERRGGHSVLGDIARRRFAERQALREERREAERYQATAERTPVRPTLEEIRIQALENWRAVRAHLRADAVAARQWGKEASREPAPEAERRAGRERDHELER